MRVHVRAINPGFEIEHAGGFPLLQHNVVEGKGACGYAIRADDARLEQ